MPVSEIRFGLLKENPDMPSGYEIFARLTISGGILKLKYTREEKEHYKTFIPNFDKIIQVSPFKDKNGRRLWEGNRVKTKYGVCTIKQDIYSIWYWLKPRYGEIITYYPAHTEWSKAEYTGSIYEKGE